MSQFINGKFTERIKLSGFPIKLDIGCGSKKKDGFIGMDREDFGQEVLWNIDNGLPFPDGSVEYIYMSHFVEHLDERQIENLFVEMTRILQDGGIIEARCPHDKTVIKYYACHFSQWNMDRVRGIVQGWNFGNGTFTIEELRESDLELLFKLTFHK